MTVQSEYQTILKNFTNLSYPIINIICEIINLDIVEYTHFHKTIPRSTWFSTISVESQSMKKYNTRAKRY